MDTVTAPTNDKVIDRVRKLLKLAGNAGSEAEAALATQRAAELMCEHEIHEAQVRLDGSPSEIRTPEPIAQRFQVTETRKRVAWHETLAYGVAAKFHCHWYSSSGHVMLFGRLSACQAAGYTMQFLIREVERLCDAHCGDYTMQFLIREVERLCDAHCGDCRDESPDDWRPSKKYRNAFRIGCAQRISARLQQPLVVTADVRQGDAEAVSFAVAAAAAAPLPSPSAGVLAVIARDREEVNDSYKHYTREWKGHLSGIGKVSSGDGYRAGKAAGDRANLGGNAKGALKRGQGVLR